MSNKLILKASAGTGKTYRLSLEFIASLIQGIDFKDILVMTFTKKATAEIKERILIFLKDICEDEEKRKEIEENIKKIYGDSLVFDITKIKRIYKNIIENKDKLKIYTIDSFTNMIFKKAIAPYLKIYSYEIIDEEENKKILIKTFEKLFENKEDFALFKEFLEDNSEKNMEIYIELIKRIIAQRWKMILIGKDIPQKTRYSHKSTVTLLERVGEILEEIAKIKGKTFFDLVRKEGLEYFRYKDKEEYLKENYKKFLEENIWDGRKVKSKKGDIDSHLEDLKYLYEEFRENLGKELFNTFIIPYEEKLLKIIEKIYSIYDEIKFREKRFTFIDISCYTFKYLEDKELGFIDENGLTDEFFEVIDGKLKSIFIDEFQDTSVLQWRILRNTLAKSENIICVGDEKQSIYGWRGGEKKLFENLSTIIGAKEEELDTCFRSQKNIVEYTNEIFKELALESDKNLPINNNWKFNEVKYRENKVGGLIKIFSGDEEVGAIEKIADEIEKNFSGNYKGIGILARRKKTLEEIASVLGERGIPYILESDTNIVENRGIDGAYFLINWLVKKDFLALLDFLRSDLINVSATNLKKILEAREKIEKNLYSGEGDFEIEREIFLTLQKLYSEYRKYNGKTEFLTYELLERIGIGNRFNSNEDTLNIFTFYKLLKEYKYFGDFLIEYEDNNQKDKFKKVSMGNDNSVSLMTIHKSKGLEFETLFYFVTKNTGGNNKSGMEFYLEMDNTYSQVNSFLITNKKFNLILSKVEERKYLENEKLKEEHEEINNLYVALTRPKKNLYVVINNIKDIAESNFSVLLSNKDRGELILSSQEKSEEKELIKFDVDLSTPKILYKKEVVENRQEALDKIYSHTLQIEGKRIRGNIVHYFLENILEWKDSEVELARRLTFGKYASIVGEKEINDILSQKNIEHIYSRCEKIFNTSWDFVYREYPAYLKVDGENKNFRIDRLMVKLPTTTEKGKIYIADYKTGKFDEEQMKNYILAVNDMLDKSEAKKEDFEIETEFIELLL